MTTPVKLDFKDIRSSRQRNNNLKVLECIQTDNKKDFYKNINESELKRILEDLEITFDELWNKCKDDIMFAKLVSKMISKKSSRQGVNDEAEQLKICNSISTLYDIDITNLTVSAIRPTKDGKIITNDEMKKLKIKKNDCLKSFDAKITGKMNGYISAKVLFGNGGHQDNVFEEMDALANWWSIYKKNLDEYLVILIDTDLTIKITNLKNKYEDKPNIKIFDHFEFQEYIIIHYSESI
jgi:hypothetical protein